MSSPLEILPQDIYHHLTADSYFADIPVFFLREETVDSQVAQALAGTTVKSAKNGAAVSVLMPVFDVSRPNAAGPHLDPQVIVRCQEIPTINHGNTGTKKTAEQIAERVARTLLHLTGQGLYGSIFPAKDFITPNRNFLPRVTYDVVFQTMMVLEKRVRVAMPVINFDPQTFQVTITCATPGAQIWFTPATAQAATQQDTYPRPSVGGVPANGEQYPGVFLADDVSPLPYTMRAAAFDLTGVLAGSDAARRRLSI